MSKALYLQRGLTMKNKVIILVLLFICGLFAGCTQKKDVSDENEISQKRLSIYAANESATLDEAIRYFTEENPDIEIELITSEEKTVEDITNAIVNKQDSPDLIVLDDFKNNEKKFQTELLPTREEIDTENLIVSLQEQQNNYSIPLRVSVPLVFATQRKLSRTEAIVEDGSKFVLTDISYEELIDIFYSYYPVNFLDDNQIIHAEQLQIFLENIKSIGSNIGASLEDKVDETKEDELYQIRKFLIDKNSVMYHNAQGIEDVKYYIGATGKVHGSATFVDGVLPQMQMAVYKNSPVIDECIDFVKIALSDEIQKNDWSDGFPVTQSALEAWGNSYQKTEESIILEDQGDKEITLKEPEESEVRVLLSMINDSSGLYIRDYELMEIIKLETFDYWVGNESVESIVNNIIDTYEKNK